MSAAEPRAGFGAEPSPATRSVEDAWAQPRGLASLSAVNHTAVGRRFVATGFVFFLLAGLLGLLMRLQLARPHLDLLHAEAFNQVFTMHGTTMMFLFAVPMVEGAGIYLIPLMIGARDLPFPRLGAFGYWCYLLGGVMLFSTLLLGVAPDGGWFIYPPFSGPVYSPGPGIDAWLLGITFVEISALAAAVELIIGILRYRAPGMTLARMPIFAWYILVTSFMIVFGFPPLIMGSVLFELERAFGLPFYDPTRGGDPLLWQHLFWLFGHPEVYIIFLPGAGVLSTVIPTFVGRPLFGYVWLVLAAVATGFLSFALWVHHMYAVGIPALSLAFFSAASMLVAVPAGIQVFVWIANLWQARSRLASPMLFALGAIFLFTFGGISGVMVAVVPFDLQVHDTYFVVAHFHYILFGALVFPMFAALHYWYPLETGRLLSERGAHVAFWLMFLGVNVTFFPMHILGLEGMPRRIYSYPASLPWAANNLLASLGAAALALGVLVFLANALWSRWAGTPAGPNPWAASSLEWATTGFGYNFRSIPTITSRDPLWDQPGLAESMARGDHDLAAAPRGFQETLVTSITDARPEHIAVLPRPSWLPLLGALSIGVFFLAFLLEAYEASSVGAALMLLVALVWLWPGPEQRRELDAEVHPGLRLPLGSRLNDAAPWNGTQLWVAIDSTLLASLWFGFLYLWIFAPAWPPEGIAPPEGLLAGLAVLAQVGASVTTSLGHRAVRRGGVLGLVLGFVLAILLALLAALVWLLLLDRFGAPPQVHAYSAMVHALVGFVLVHQALSVMLAAGALAARWRRFVDQQRNLVVRCAALMIHFTTLVGAVVAAALVFVPVSG
jgi:cytochrome c oxidase subunit I+III